LYFNAIKIMDILWIIIAVLLMIGGVLGSVLPFLPGPPLSFAALLVMQLQASPPFTAKFLWFWAAVTVVVTILDYVVPLYGSKRFGGTTYGVWGCTIGLIAGVFFPPWGLIIGPFVGALLGEMVGNADAQNAFRAAIGSFAGFLFGTLIKLIASLVMFYYLIVSLW
jgi:uncharacterized protein YqgC (DUF456 family)